MTGLTDAERDALWESIYSRESEADIERTVGRILAARLADVWDEGWTAAKQVTDLDGVKVWAHTVFPQGYEGNPYRGVTK